MRNRIIWLITVGEPLPLEHSRDRLWRTGLLAGILARRGANVIWWTSTVDHFRKQYFVRTEARIVAQPGVTLQFLAGRRYHKNVSLARLINHAQIARRFAQLAPAEQPPDVVLCSYPTVELSREAVRYGAARKVPVILDVRDLWPDSFLDLVPAAARGVARLILGQSFRSASWAFAHCDAIFGVSTAYRDWGLAKAGRGRRDDDRVFPLGYGAIPVTPEDATAIRSRLQSANVPRDALLATFVGTFGRTYDLHTVIEAARAMRDDPRICFVLCGSGEREAELRTLARGLRNVVFTGWLAAPELSSLLAMSTLGLAAYASHAPQGIPNKVIEYLWAGLPVVCSLRGESRDLLEAESCGSYYVAGDPESLVEALGGLAADAERRRRMGAAARGVFERRFAAAAVYGAMADHLEELATRRELRPAADLSGALPGL